MKNILITGGLGFVGGRLANHLAKSGHKIQRQRRQKGGIRVTCFGMLLPNGLICLREKEGCINAQKYVCLLPDYAVRIMKLNMKSSFYFVQDNCTCHVARETRNFFMF